VHDDVAVRSGGEVAWAFRKSSPQLKAVLDDSRRATAEKIGPETVPYVSNIYKYCIAYRLIPESTATQKYAVEKIKGGVK
jgi:hypothetical protein